MLSNKNVVQLADLWVHLKGDKNMTSDTWMNLFPFWKPPYKSIVVSVSQVAQEIIFGLDYLATPMKVLWIINKTFARVNFFNYLLEITQKVHF